MILIKIAKAFIVAFSMYSKIPMPGFKWDSDDMKYHFCFFPFIGAVIGVLEFAWLKAFINFQFDRILFNLFAVAIPVLTTGGIHLDGFIDTMDALHSYQDREKKLEILKDPHVGAFGIICLVMYFVITIGFLFAATKFIAYICICFSFIISRALSGISVCVFKKAKSQGMAFSSGMNLNRNIVVTVLALETAAAIGAMFYLCNGNFLFPTVTVSVIGLVFLYYCFMSRKNFGGITGDLAGFLVCSAESAVVVSSGIVCILLG